MAETQFANALRKWRPKTGEFFINQSKRLIFGGNNHKMHMAQGKLITQVESRIADRLLRQKGKMKL